MIPLLGLFAALAATPQTLPAVLERAVSGDTVHLAPGSYGVMTLPRKTYSPWLVIQARSARFTGIVARNVAGLWLVGGYVQGPSEGSATGVMLDGTRDVRVEQMVVTGAKAGMQVANSERVEILANRFEGVRSDGVDVTASRQVLIQGNSCTAFKPILASYDAIGRLVADGDHSDCIQVWSTPGTAPVSDVSVIGNSADGSMQGVFFNDAMGGGYDRVTIRGNKLRLSSYNGIVLRNVRGGAVYWNWVLTIPGSRLLGGNRSEVKSWIQASGKDLTVCGNVVDAWPKDGGTQTCPK